jgi:hypothetical protein
MINRAADGALGDTLARSVKRNSPQSGEPAIDMEIGSPYLRHGVVILIVHFSPSGCLVSAILVAPSVMIAFLALALTWSSVRSFCSVSGTSVSRFQYNSVLSKARYGVWA